MTKNFIFIGLIIAFIASSFTLPFQKSVSLKMNTAEKLGYQMTSYGHV
ncbi:MAG: hypothetical protein ACJAVH_002195, partial [Bacteroidia bacterium]